MGIRADQAMITWFGWRDVWGPRGGLGVERSNLKREVLCSYMFFEVNCWKIYVLCNLNYSERLCYKLGCAFTL